MQSLKKFYFGKQKAKVNTYIGGIGGTINTPALLATKLGVNVNRIKLFKVTGLNVECAVIGESYVGLGGGFRYSAVTYFIDTGVRSVVASQEFTGCSSFTKAIFPNATVITTDPINYRRWTFTDCGNLKLVYMPIVTNILTTEQIIMFRNINASCKIYCHPSLATANAGSPHVEIAVAIARGASIRYVTNFTPPNAVTNLSAGTITSTTIQLNFTPPTGNTNAIDYYEIYVNDTYKSNITASGQTISGLTTNTNYNIKIIARDIFYNPSNSSNIINVNTI